MKRWIAAIAACMICVGCQQQQQQKQSSLPPSTARADPAERASRGRAQMWTQNCIRCHNARPPGYYSDREWQVAMHHMRMRCSITKQEYDAILSFLQSAN
jgi:hypothetical protein